jgi:hypothetical protein
MSDTDNMGKLLPADGATPHVVPDLLEFFANAINKETMCSILHHSIPAKTP